MKARENRIPYIRIFLLSLLAMLLIAPLTNVSAAEGTYAQDEARSMLEYINEFRKGSDAWYWNEDNTKKVKCSGLEDLVYDYELEKVAMLRAKEIAESFSHTRPNGSSCYTAYDDCGYKWERTVGENIAYGQDSAYSVYIAWREDKDDYLGQGHRRNMLNSSFKAIGIGCYVVNGRKYWVQEFTGNTPTGSALIPPDDTTQNSDDNKKGKPDAEKAITELISDVEIFELSLLTYSGDEKITGKVKLTKNIMARAAAMTVSEVEEIYTDYWDDSQDEDYADHYYSFNETELTKSAKNIFGKKVKKKNLTSDKFSYLIDAYKDKKLGYVIMVSMDTEDVFDVYDFNIKKNGNKYTATKDLYWGYWGAADNGANYRFTYTVKKSKNSSYGYVITGLKIKKLGK
ncbi:MAG: hypothetical protein K6G24_14420 [Lachnospiraceae bacterium]|nr:hypothetical protein [Lachnospiraceae bacterium]